MSTESELESDEEFDYIFSEEYQSDMYNHEYSCTVINGRSVNNALKKAIWSGRIDRVRRLLGTAPRDLQLQVVLQERCSFDAIDDGSCCARK